MADVYPGAHKYSDADSIPHTLGSDTAVRGDALTIGAGGDAVTTTGSNGFLGVLQSATQADLDNGNLGPGVESEDVAQSGEAVTLATQGIVRASVVGTFDSDGDGTNEDVKAGQKLEAGSSGALANISDGASPPSGIRADVGEAQALTDEDADGYAIVYLG